MEGYKMDLEKLFEKCINYYSHEGEFKVGENTITIFRRCSYEDFDNTDENGDPEWVEGDEAVGAFVNHEEFFGWWPQDRDDMYECMKEVLEYLMKNKGIKFTLNVKVTRWPDEDEKKSERKAKLVKMLTEDFGVEIGQVKNIKVTYDDAEDALNCKVINFNDYWNMLAALNDTLDGNFEVKIAEDDPNKAAVENMFKYKYDLL